MNGLHTTAIDELFKAILRLETIEECYAFFEDLCTVKELKEISQRLEVAFLLNKGLNYQEVAEQTGVSSATISRVKKCLEYGSGGYQRAIEKAGLKEGRKSSGDMSSEL